MEMLCYFLHMEFDRGGFASIRFPLWVFTPPRMLSPTHTHTHVQACTRTLSDVSVSWAIWVEHFCVEAVDTVLIEVTFATLGGGDFSSGQR